MKLADYHDSFLTGQPVLIPRHIAKDYDRKLLPDRNVKQAKLADTCPACASHSLYGNYTRRGHKVTKVSCWNVNCLWTEADDAQKGKRGRSTHYKAHRNGTLLKSILNGDTPYMV